jgi:ATP-dependent DNA helicase RecQ
VRHVASFDRPNLALAVQPVAGERQRLDGLAASLASAGGVSIVYVPTRGLSEAVASAAFRRGCRAVPYHAGLDPDTRRRALDRFLDGDARVVVASAFGMGIDKPDVRLVVHWTLPPTPEAYYQEAGRAGRDGAPARCLLLYRRGDAELHRRQLDVTFPAPELAEAVWADPGRAQQVAANTRESIERLRRELRPERGGVDWDRVRGRRRGAEARIAAMARYASAPRCRRVTLLEWFGERTRPCGRCDHCQAPVLRRLCARFRRG